MKQRAFYCACPPSAAHAFRAVNAASAARKFLRFWTIRTPWHPTIIHVIEAVPSGTPAYFEVVAGNIKPLTRTQYTRALRRFTALPYVQDPPDRLKGTLFS
jgi:hypothetical protein